jgi:predicted enzyme related to lactoylglutathione lyase
MTRRRKLKRRIRERMTRTGETYSTARAVFAGRARTEVAGGPLIMVPVAEMPRAIAFYRDALGFPLVSQSPDDTWAELGEGTSMLGLHPNATTGVDTGIGLVVRNVGMVVDAVVALGGAVVERNDHVTTVSDPDGNLVRLMGGA